MWPGPALRNLRREWREANALLGAPGQERRFLFHSEGPYSYQYLAAFVEDLRERHGRTVSCVTAAADDPLLASGQDGLRAYYVRHLLPALILHLECDVFVTTTPGMGTLRLPRPHGCRCVYAFHSLVSVHEVYPEGAFDHYDAFLCAGPHHRRELLQYAHVRKVSVGELFEVGYPKLDRLIADHHRWVRRTARTTVLIAPSWGVGNVLETCGVDLVERLLSTGVRVIVRPHPCFFGRLYPAGRAILGRLGRRFADHADVTIDSDFAGEDSLHEADLMISDYSGVAYEYAFSTLRPVLFVDVPRKTRNPRWQLFGLPTFEDVMRRHVGSVVPPDDVPGIVREAARLLSDARAYADGPSRLRVDAVYNLGMGAEVGAQALDALARDKGEREYGRAPASCEHGALRGVRGAR